MRSIQRLYMAVIAVFALALTLNAALMAAKILQPRECSCGDACPATCGCGCCQK